jgi:glycosyltransferase involved in cell wall biosynthesis
MSQDERAKIVGQAERLGISDRLVLSASPDASGVTSDARLNLLYNACEVGMNTAMGEGWGLVSVEHAATGAAQIVPRNSACQEMWARDDVWGEPAVLLESVDTGVPEFSLLAMSTVSADAVAAALRTLYADPDRLRALSRASYARATQPTWTWASVAAQWDALLRGVTQAVPHLSRR